MLKHHSTTVQKKRHSAPLQACPAASWAACPRNPQPELGTCARKFQPELGEGQPVQNANPEQAGAAEPASSAQYC